MSLPNRSTTYAQQVHDLPLISFTCCVAVAVCRAEVSSSISQLSLCITTTIANARRFRSVDTFASAR